MSEQETAQPGNGASRPLIDDDVKQNVKSRNTWMRFFYMLVFALLMGLAEIVLAVVVIIQFFTVLLTGERNDKLLGFGRDLARYVFDIWRYLVFATEAQPFPFSDWQSSSAESDNDSGADDPSPTSAG